MRITRKSLIVIELCRPLTRPIDLEHSCALVVSTIFSVSRFAHFARFAHCAWRKCLLTELMFVPRFCFDALTQIRRSFFFGFLICILRTVTFYSLIWSSTLFSVIFFTILLWILSACVYLCIYVCLIMSVQWLYVRLLNAKRISYRFFIFICINVPFVNGVIDNWIQKGMKKTSIFQRAFFSAPLSIECCWPGQLYMNKNITICSY